MSRRIMLLVFAVTVSAMAASAADLPAQSKIGAIFAEPTEAGPADYRSPVYFEPIIPYNNLPNPIWARGGYNYGSPWSYYYGGSYYGGPYYGGPYVVRLPYVCSFYGYC